MRFIESIVTGNKYIINKDNIVEERHVVDYDVVLFIGEHISDGWIIPITREEYYGSRIPHRYIRYLDGNLYILHRDRLEVIGGKFKNKCELSRGTYLRNDGTNITFITQEEYYGITSDVNTLNYEIY